MSSDLCIGIASTNDSLEIAALEPGKAAVVTKFPATVMGIEGIRAFLSGYANPVRMAVAGVAAVSLGNVRGRETFIVSSAIADQAVALARYAEHAA
ncbi:MAG: hypothetical protein FD131_3572 [Rhodocyclaceae bacterium]|nr:MAG: hypothetical protein FD131_3572 [Rhodocyclaceae bacterium]